MDGGAGAVGGDEEICFDCAFLALICLELHDDSLAVFVKGGDFVAVEMRHPFLILIFFGDFAVFALHAMDVCSEDVVD